MLKYISPLCIFAAAVIGVVGDTFDSKRHGLATITSLGWAAIFVAFFFFVVTVIGAYRAHKEVNWQEQQRASVKRVAHRQISMGVRHLLSPFESALYGFYGTPANLDFDLDQMNNDLTYFTELLERSDVRSEFYTIDLKEKPNVFPDCLWWEYLSRAARDADKTLDDAAAKYSGYIEPDTLVKVENLRIDDFVRMRLYGMDDYVLANTHMAALPLGDVLAGLGGYQEFDVMLKKLRELGDSIDQ